MKFPYPPHHLIKTGPIKTCQVCNSKKIHLILDLGYQPLANTLLSEVTLHQPEITYPLRMMWCEKCTGVELDYCVEGKEVYHPDYPYKPGITQEVAQYQKTMSISLIKRYKLTPNDLVIDIGSNDGTLLKGFKSQGLKVLGVEPTNIAKFANANGIETIQAFFDRKLAEKIKKKYGQASLIVTTNTFAHMQTIGEFVMGAHALLEKDGVFVNETHYLLDIIKEGQFDSMYHEHLRTYSLRSQINLFKPYDFTVTYVERGERYGGNIRIHTTKGKRRVKDPSVVNLLATEKKIGLDKLETYQKFARRVKKARLAMMEFLITAKKKGKLVVGDACPARAATLLNYYGVDPELMPYITEQPTSLKLGKYLAGKHMPIVNNQKLIDEQPDYVILLAWHLAATIMQRLKARGLKSNFLVPLPDFKIIANSTIPSPFRRGSGRGLD